MHLAHLILQKTCILMVVLMFAQLFCVLKYPRISGDAAHLAETSPSSCPLKPTYKLF